MSTLRPLYISTLGLEETNLKVLQVAVGMLAQDGIECSLLSSNDLRGDLIVIDVESEEGRDYASRLRPGQVKVLLSSTPVTGKNTVSLTKPARVATLKDLLMDICAKMLRQLDNSKSRLQPPPATSPSSSTKQEMNFFLLLLDIKRKQKIVKISYSNFPEIYINGINNTIMCSDHSAINDLISIPFENLTISTINPNRLNYDNLDLDINTLDRTLWKAGIVCSKGKILPGHNTNTPVKLKAWPNFTRNSFKPEYFKLAAVLARQAVSLNTLRKITNVPMEDIINFFNAAFGVGLIMEETSQPDTQQETEPPPVKHKNFFRRRLLKLLSKRLGFDILK